MKSLSRILALAALAGGMAAVPASGQVVISQAFGNGGGSAPLPNADYVELFNNGVAAVDLAGWSVQLSRNIGNASNPADWIVVTIPSGTINPGQYFLVQVMAAAASGLPLVPDASSAQPVTTVIFGQEGGVALVNNSTPLPNDICPVGTSGVVDFVKWGGISGPTCFEGAGRAAEVSTSSWALFRRNHGCTDTNNNAADFTEGSPQPRNTSFEYPYALDSNLATLPALANTTVTITARGRSNRCDAVGNVALTSATVDLSSIPGGPSALALHDDGLNGDAAAGDNLWSVQYTIPAGTPTAKYPATFSLNSASGNVVKSHDLIVPVDGDMCGNARVLTQASLPVTVGPIVPSTLTDDPILSPCRSGLVPLMSRFGTWFTITPSSDFVLQALKTGTAVSIFNQSLWTGACDNLTVVDCDDSNNLANWRLSAGVTYYLLSAYDNDSLTVAPSNVTYTFSAITPPGNDLCTGAIDLNAQSFPYVDTNVQQFHDATGDADNSCDNSPVVTRRGVWYSYLPPVDSILRTAETNSAIIVSSSLWSGTCPGGLSMVSCSGSESTSYYLAAGQRHYILIGSNSTAQPGTSTTGYTNTFTVTVPPANDLCSNAVDLGSLASPLSINPGPVLSTASSDTTTCGAATFGAWYRFTAPTAGLLRLNESSSIDVSWAVLPSCGSASTNLCSTTDTDQFVSLTAGQQVVILLYTTSTSTTATNLAFEFIPPLANDVCTGAIDLNALGLPNTVVLDARNSTIHDIDQGDCTTRADTQYGVWFKYTAPFTGILTMAESGGAAVDFGMFLSASSVDPCGTLGPSVGCSDDSDAGAFQVQSGETYMILAGNGSGSGSGPFQPSAPYTINFGLEAVVVNDVCATATNISNLLPYTETVSAFLAQHEPDVSCNPATAAQLFNGVWYTMTPSQDMNLTIWESGQASLNVTVYNSCGGSEVFCQTNDVTFPLVAGQTYYFLIGRNLISSAPATGSGSTYTLNFVRSQRFTNDACADATQITQTPFSTIIDLSTATNDAVPALPCSSNTVNVVQGAWYKIQTQTAGQLSGSIEVDYARANSGVGALFRSLDGTCGNLDPSPIVCATDPTSVPLVIDLLANLDAATTYYLIVGLPGSSSDDFVISIDNVNYSGTLDAGGQFCCRGTTCNTVASGSCTGTVAGSNSLVVSSCGAGTALASCCYADFNHDGNPSIDDLFIYLNAYFAVSPYANMGGDGIAAPNIDDLFLYINAYFAGCQ